MRNLNYIVQNYRLSNGIVSTQYDQQFLQWAVNGLKKMKQLGLFQEVVKAVELPVNLEKHTANLPNDFDTDSLIRMGVCRHGVFIQFDLNDYLCLPQDKDCACATDEQISAGINACCDGGGETEGALARSVRVGRSSAVGLRAVEDRRAQPSPTPRRRDRRRLATVTRSGWWLQGRAFRSASRRSAHRCREGRPPK